MKQNKMQSRTYNVTVNAFWGVTLQILTILCQFVTRTIFVKLLGQEYLGVNDIFFNIVQLLTITDLGIGTAVTFCLYKPIANNDEKQIISIMQFYKKAFRVIASIAGLLGLCLIPFLDVLIKEPPAIKESLLSIYLMYLLFAVTSYFFSYKRTLITANQKDYIVNITYKLTYFLQIILQIIFLVITHNFMLYLLMQILCNILYNFLTACKADQMYPYLKDKTPIKLERGLLSTIKENVKSLLVYRIGDAILNAIDNLLMSALVGVVSVAICSNYLLIQKSVTEFIKLVVNSFTASIGNLNAVGEKERQETVFRQTYMITHWLYGFLTIGIITCATPVIKLWFGEKYIMAEVIVFAMAFRNYVEGMQYIPYTYRTTAGYLSEYRFAPLVAAGINIILSIWFANYWGVAGIFLATIAARLVTTTWVNVVVVYKKCFEKKATGFLFTMAKYMLELLAVVLINVWVIKFIPLDGILGLIVNMLVCTILTNGLFLLLLWRNPDFKELMKHILKFIKKLIRR